MNPKFYLFILSVFTLVSCEGNNCCCANNRNDDIQLGIFLIALSTLLFYVIQDFYKNRRIRLSDDLKNLVQYLNKKELNRPKYIQLQINFPESLNHLDPNGNNSIFNINKDISVYDSFYEFVKKTASKLKGTEFTLQQMIDLYNIFTKNLVQRDYLDQTFQILYSCVHKTLSPIGYNKKVKIEKIQNCLTSKQLIYYFFNQIHFADRQRIYNQYIEELYEYEFFKKMFESDAYREIEKQIPLSVEKLLYKQIKNKN